MQDSGLVCNSLRELDALVAERLMGWKAWLLPQDPDSPSWPWGKILQPPEFSPKYPSSLLVELENNQPWCLPWLKDQMRGTIIDLPCYTTWAGVEAVIQNRESAGYHWRMNSPLSRSNPSNSYWAGFSPQGCCGWPFRATGATGSVACCLAALASEGVFVVFSGV